MSTVHIFAVRASRFFRSPETWTQYLIFPRLTHVEDVIRGPEKYLPVVTALAQVRGRQLRAVTIWLPDDAGGEAVAHFPYRAGEPPVRNPKTKDGGFYPPVTTTNPNIIS